MGSGSTTVNVHEAKTQLSRLLRRVAMGEEVVIARAGHPVARLVPIAEKAPRQAGTGRGLLQLAPDFEEPLPEELLAAFEA